MASATPLLLIPTLLLLIPPPSTEALDNITSPKFAPTKAIIIATILSFAILLALYLYSRIYLFHRAATILSSRHKGLSPSLLRSFPTMLYSDIKDHKIGKSALECAVCLNEFEHKDLLRLLPNCSHIFHEDCIDAWLASHVTCPVCRDVLEKDESGEISAGVVVEEEEEEQAVAVVVEEEEDKRKERSGRRTSRREGAESLLRSYTTGHIEEDWERYTLRLPESVRNDVIVAGMLKRDRSLPVRGAEGGRSERERQSLWVGKLAQLPSFFVRSWSAKSARKGQEGSLKDGVFQSSA